MRMHITRKRTCCKNGSPVKHVLIKVFMEMLHMIKLYHWNTHSYSQHKATDELHERLSANIDKFVEVFLGKNGSRLRHLDESVRLINSGNTSNFKNRMYEFREFMISMSDCFHKDRDSDLLSIRDDILADINQFLYLLTLNE
jgi:DNA-binding ferritin-like protein